jgi:sugar-specific transcriptional regulator TrmB
MNEIELEKLGLNRNEAKVYFALLRKGQSNAADLVKALGIHRNIIYDNLEKLIEKGLVSYIIEGTKKKFIAEDPHVIIDFLEEKKKIADNKIKSAKNLLPEIVEILSKNKENQEASLFRGVKGIKKILSEVLTSKEFWVIGVSNASVEALGDTFWTNFNLKRKTNKIKEHLLLNYNFKNTVNIMSDKLSQHKILPKELTQVTEFLIFDNSVAITVYSEEPIGFLVRDSNIYKTFKQQFDLLWEISK